MTVARFGIGLLELTDANEARPGEVMACHDTGLIGVMNPHTGKLVSYEYITRFKNTYEHFKSRLIADGTVGKVGKIDVGNEPISIVNNNTVVTTPELVISTLKKLSFVRFGLDIDVINADSKIGISDEVIVTLCFTTARNVDTNTSRSYSITGTLSDINNKVTVPSYTSLEVLSESINHDLVFDSIKIVLPNGIDPATHTIIINSILVSYKEV